MAQAVLQHLSEQDVRVTASTERVAVVIPCKNEADNLRELSATIKRYPAGALISGPPEKVRLPVEKSQ